MTWLPQDAASFARLLLPAPAEASAVSWVALVLAAVYLTGFILQRRRRRPLPWWRAVAFLVGAVMLWLLTGTALERYGRQVLSVLMLQQLTLMIVVPSLLVLGAPGVLLLALAPRRGVGKIVQRLALGVIRRRVGRVILHPALGIGLFLFAYYGLYLSGLATVVLSAWQGDLVLEAFFLLTGLLFAVPIFSSGPLPRRVTHAERALDVFVEMGLHAFFGVLVMVSRTPLVPELAESTAALGIDPLEDQRLAGGLAWSYGEGPAVLTLLYVMERWFRSEASNARRRDFRTDPDAAAELDAYNAYLGRLQQRDDRRLEEGQAGPE